MWPKNDQWQKLSRKFICTSKKYRENKKAHPELYRQPIKKETEPKEQKKRGRKPTRGIVKVDEPAADEWFNLSAFKMQFILIHMRLKYWKSDKVVNYGCGFCVLK